MGQLRTATWRLRAAIREHSDAPLRTRHCGLTRYTRSPAVLATPESAWWHGSIRCRARVCPVCWLGRRQRAARTICWCLSEWERDTKRNSRMATLTLAHGAEDSVSLTRGVRAAWRRMQQTAAWRRYRRGTGLETVVAEEVTFGANGWHPHLHIAALQREHGDVLDEASRWFEAWADAVRRELGDRHEPSLEHGVDLMDCAPGTYLAKLGLELADPGAAKSGALGWADAHEPDEFALEREARRGRVRGMSPLELVYRAELDRYFELMTHRKRARDITYSRGLRAIRDREPEPALETSELAVSAADYELVRHREGDLGLLHVLDIASTNGLEAAQEEIARVCLKISSAG